MVLDGIALQPMVRRCFCILCWIFGVGLIEIATAQEVDPSRQFDFWIGAWEVENRYQMEDGRWMSAGTARNQVFSILEGKAILELWEGTMGERELVGFSVRYYDPESEFWQLVLNWPQPGSPSFFELDGGFRHGRGEFLRTFEDSTGTEVRVRYTFSDISRERFRWDQAFSRDQGKSWRTRWIMEFSREAEEASWPDSGESALTYRDGSRCGGKEARQFDRFEGAWTGTAWTPGSKDGSEESVSTRSYRILDGCAVLTLVQRGLGEDVREEMRMASYGSADSAWQILHLDDLPEERHWYSSGRWDGGTFEPDGDGIRWQRLEEERAAYEVIMNGRVVRKVRLVKAR